MKKIQFFFSLLAGVSLLGSAVAQTPRPSPINPECPILLIGMDGFAANVLKDNLKEFPNLAQLIKNGSYTYESRTVLPSSSAVNWHSMFTASPPELHGITKATSTSPEVKPRIIGEFGKYPGIFGLMKQQRRNDLTGCFFEWDGMKYVMEMEAIGKTGNGTGQALTDDAMKFISGKKPSLMFVVFAQPDYTGHSKGWGSPEYIAMCKELDSYVGQLVKCETQTFKGKDPIIMIVSDHGGTGKGHGGKTMEEMNHLLILCGKGIKPGYELRDVNMIYDIGATLAYFKGLKMPQYWIGRPITEALVK